MGLAGPPDLAGTGLSIVWTWPTTDGDLADARAETELRSPDGVVRTLTQDGLAATEWASDHITFGAVTVPQGDLAEAGPGWTAQTRLVVGGEVVGACTVRAEDWESAELD